MMIIRALWFMFLMLNTTLCRPEEPEYKCKYCTSVLFVKRSRKGKLNGKDSDVFAIWKYDLLHNINMASTNLSYDLFCYLL